MSGVETTPTGRRFLDALAELRASPGDAGVATRALAAYRDGGDALRALPRSALALPPSAPPFPFVTPPRAEHFRNNLHMPPPWRVARPTSLHELRAAVASAASEPRTIRALGGGWGFSNVAATEGLVLDLAALDAVVPIDPSTLRAGVDPGHLLHFEGGATIDRLTRHLATEGRALVNQPGFEGLTFVGAMACGGHGSGITLGPLSAQVRALHLLQVTDEGQLRTLRVEPATGAISRPDARWPDVDDLVQDDATFRACTVAMGTLGVVTSAVIETRRAFFLREDRTLRPWHVLRGELEALVRDPAVHSVHVWVNPYEVRGVRSAVVSRYTEHGGPAHGSRPVSYALGGVQPLADLFVFVANHLPEALPGLLDGALAATTGHDVVMPSHEALNFGAPNHLGVVAASVGVPATRAVEAVEAIAALAREALPEGRTFTSPIGLRWVRAADDHLSPQRGRDTCMIEVPILNGTNGAGRTLDAYVQRMMADFEGRPHWGQHNPMSPAQLRASYGAPLERFLAVYRAFNPNGTWDNAFTRQVRLRT